MVASELGGVDGSRSPRQPRVSVRKTLLVLLLGDEAEEGLGEGGATGSSSSGRIVEEKAAVRDALRGHRRFLLTPRAGERDVDRLAEVEEEKPELETTRRMVRRR